MLISPSPRIHRIPSLQAQRCETGKNLTVAHLGPCRRPHPPKVDYWWVVCCHGYVLQYNYVVMVVNLEVLHCATLFCSRQGAAWWCRPSWERDHCRQGLHFMLLCVQRVIDRDSKIPSWYSKRISLSLYLLLIKLNPGPLKHWIRDPKRFIYPYQLTVSCNYWNHTGPIYTGPNHTGPNYVVGKPTARGYIELPSLFRSLLIPSRETMIIPPLQAKERDSTPGRWDRAELPCWRGPWTLSTVV